MSLSNVFTWIISFILGAVCLYGFGYGYRWVAESGVILMIYPYLISLMFAAPFTILVVKPAVDILIKNIQQRLLN